MKKLAFIFFTLLPFISFGQCFTEQNYNTAGESTFTIPGDAGTSHLVEIEIKGGDGGAFMWGANPPSEGGEGANMKASFIIDAGAELLIMVGQKGVNGPGSPAGGGGAGGTAVVINNTDVLIAAGAGGGGGQNPSNVGEGGFANTDSPAEGGDGPGTSGGGGFNEDGQDGQAGSGGGAGTLTGWGLGGTGGVVAGGGGNGFGGGGGGYKGGDGATGSGGDLRGKGGDSFVNTGYSSTVIFNIAGGNGQGTNSDGFATITCIPLDGVEIMLGSQTDASCFGASDGSITVIASGGIDPFTFTLNGTESNTTGIFTGLAAGTYTVEVEDGTGSTSEIQVTIGQPDQLFLNEVMIIDNVCFESAAGSIEVIATGGTSSGTYTYTINGGGAQTTPLFDGLEAGIYTIAVIDDVDCFEVIVLEVADGPEIMTTIQTSDVTCFGDANGSVFVVAFGGNGDYSYSLDGINFQVSEQFFDLEGGDYIVTIMDGEGCTMEENFEIIEPDLLEISVDDITGISCNNGTNGTVTLSGSGGVETYLFAVSGGTFETNPIITGLGPGETTLVIMDANECIDSTVVTIDNPDPVDLIILSQTDINCGEVNTGTANLNLEGATGTTYELNGTTNTDGMFSDLAAGSYMALATSDLGCQDSVEVIIGQSSSINVSADDVSHILCFGETNGSITVSADGGVEPFSYAIDGGDFSTETTFSDLTGGTHIVSVMDNEGCVSDLTVEIEEPAELLLVIDGTSSTTCVDSEDGGVSFVIYGGVTPYMYGEIVINQDSALIIIEDQYAAGALDMIIVDGNGCEVLETVMIPSPEPISLFYDSITPVDCALGNLGSAYVFGQGGTDTLMISVDGAPALGNVEDLAAGEHTIEAVDANGCTNTLQFDIPKEGVIEITSVEYSNVSCFGAADGQINNIIVSGGFGMYAYALNGDSDPDVISGPLDTGNYIISVVDLIGCEGMIEFEVSQPDELTLEVIAFNIDDGSGNGSITVAGNGGTPDYKYSIDGGVSFQDSSKFSGLGNESHMITIEDANGCTNTITFTLTNTSEEVYQPVNIYPNPTSAQFHFSKNVQQITIIDGTGQLILTQKIGSTIDLKEQPQGVYIVRYNFEGNFYSSRVIKI